MAERTWVDICNSALRMMGEPRITNFDEGTERAILCNDNYEDARDRVLEMHEWNSATAHQALAPLVAAPDNPDYDYQFQLPNDCLRVIAKSDSTADWEVEGRFLLCNINTCTIKYVKRVPEPNELAPLLAQAISARLAADIAYSIKEDRATEQAMEQKFAGYFTEARNQDNRGKLRQEDHSDLWIDV